MRNVVEGRPSSRKRGTHGALAERHTLEVRRSVEPEHVVTSRAVYDHSVEQYLEAVGSEVSPEFEAPIDVAVLATFAKEAAAR